MVILNFIAKINSIEFIMQAICFHLMCYTAHFEISQQYFGLSISWYKQPKIQSSPLRTRNNTRNVFHLLFIMCVTRFDSSCHVVFIVSVFQELCSSLLYWVFLAWRVFHWLSYSVVTTLKLLASLFHITKGKKTFTCITSQYQSAINPGLILLLYLGGVRLLRE